MFKYSVTALLVSLTVTSTPLFAQTLDRTQTLPNAKPGECYAKVVTPAKFETRTEEIVVQEGSERIQTTAATFESVDQRIMVREASRVLKASPVAYENVSEKIETRPAEANWEMKIGNATHPASPGALEGIAASGVNLDTVGNNVCFREYYTPAEYRTEDRRILKRAGGETITVTPAEYETVTERVLVKDASTRLTNVPAVYRTETESVLVEPARSVWKEGRGPLERIDDTTGEIVCLVEIPARYETITRSVLETPASTLTVQIPAVYEDVQVQRLVRPAAETRSTIEPQYATVPTRVKVADAGFFWLKKDETADSSAEYSGREVCLIPREAETTTISKQIISSPASVIATESPAQFETVKVQRLITPAGEQRSEVPRQVRTVTREVQVSPPTLVWRRVLCETNVTNDIIRDLQQALADEGFDPGAIDGVLGSATLTAVRNYQEDNSLDTGGITHETLDALKVNL